ncbi:2-succinyl-5-enolpyruvyl-6-hydroxy-3-cyclohexene-1-carboxylic-acid synthase [Nocardioides mesophilus]|uniref:2-succinyl-5-enolpyruvyl-6-hydroxy-3-cyclohexene-1-carboxylate synthase n=1 Tax=Nocardioides mesophilus TaxID=433659 RepID=A0A7G9R6P3_9ACTN|nr:2-succinyl-5-enolpyruvyl-6-hydroxy-3-cyclohexene-1-carboxylic-acid synthase [Nocardioides mesophilus]QNN51268.1 2-succinyl-5-enolpyruvyl-6-hydroxy-3-cyclohexene-1-carboxylic-acid synthase [Nocardioides mesophilus]
MSTPANAATAWASTLVDELVRCGVRHAVLSPGSRSAALAFALHAAHVEGRLALHTRVDERSAGFLALGLARTSRTPVPVVTTSGTAVANLLPAVLEASHAGLALLVLTADRPARLRGTNANQTTDQVKLFGGAVRLFADVPAAHPGPGEARQLAGWRALAAKAAWTARGRLGGRPGPVHLNLQFEEPLAPGDADGWDTPTGSPRPHGAPWMLPGDPPLPSPEPIDRERRTVVVAGDDAGPPARILAESAGWPLLAEPTSGSRTGANAVRTYRLLLADEELAGRIERVVVFGHPTLSRPVSRLLARDDVEIIAVQGHAGWSDPGHAVHRVVTGLALDGAVPTWRADAPELDPPHPDDWLQEWLRRDADTSRALDALLAAQPALAPQQVAAAVAAALPPQGLLFVGASNPVRDLDLMVPRYRVGDRRLVIGNRGLAGIDGSVSTAIGAALGRPSTSRAFALLGDVTFLHDSNGLVLGPQEPRPDLTVVVVNDDGGSIFASLEPGAPPYADAFERLFGTPHHVDLASLCAATRTPHWRVDTLAELQHALASPAGGIEVVEAVVGRAGRRDLDAQVRALLS